MLKKPTVGRVNRSRMSIAVLLVLVASAGSGCESARGLGGAPVGERGSIADQGFLRQFAETYRFRLGKPASITISPDEESVLFLRSGPRDFVRNLYEYDISTRRERVLLTAEQLMGGEEEELTAEEKARRERMRLAARGIAGYELSKDGRLILVPLGGRLFVVERASGRVRSFEPRAGAAIDPQFSPDATKIAFAAEGDLHVIDIATGEEMQLTNSATDTISNATSEFVAQEEMGRMHGYWWSPDSAFIAYQQTDESMVEHVFIMDPLDPFKEPQSWRYPRPGKDNADVKLGVIPAAGGSTTWIDWNHEAYPYLATVKWQKSAPLTLLVQNRTQTEQVLYAADHETGELSELLTETDEAWINLNQGVPDWNADGTGFAWLNEDQGDWTLRLIRKDGGPDAVVAGMHDGARSYLGQDEHGEWLDWTRSAPGRAMESTLSEVSRDPTRSQIVSSSGSGWMQGETLVLSTGAPGIYDATFSKPRNIFVESASTQSGEEWWRIKNRQGDVLGELRSVAESPAFDVNAEWTSVRDPETGLDFYAVMIRPRNFRPSRQYPVIVSVYGGPHSQQVLKAANRYYLEQWMADHGFIVVKIDGRGTPNRGREWERIIKNDLITIPLRDQVTALTLLGRQYGEMDLSRTGIFGWSFGGYFSAHAVMQHPEIFACGVAGAPVADWADYDTHYTERYMGLPEQNPEGYARANVLTHVDELERPLLIIHGTADDNVYLTHSLKMTDALLHVGKPFEFMPLAGHTHMVTDPDVVERLYGRVMAFFGEHLK